ncbi:hypothetical protein MRX96_056570 [Rhipicephalus microplus]
MACTSASSTTTGTRRKGSAQLVIGEDAPVFEHVFAERQVRPGGSVSLRCSASGTPLPQITWSLDGTPVPEHYHIRIGDYVSGERLVHSYVNLTGVRVEDGGLYSCVARNGVGPRLAHSQAERPGKTSGSTYGQHHGTSRTHDASTLRSRRTPDTEHRLAERWPLAAAESSPA